MVNGSGLRVQGNYGLWFKVNGYGSRYEMAKQI